MTPRSSIRLLAVSLLAATLGAQAPKFVYSPAGAELMQGGNNNTIPFWSWSATYQQIHDYDDMVRTGSGKPILMKAMAFRPANTATVTGRSWDLQINLGNTTVDSQNISTTFSTNLGPLPKRVVGTQTTPFQKVSFSSFTGSGTPTQPGVVIPFGALHIQVPVKGMHFCWEWRHKNASINTSMSMDAVQGASHRGLIKPSVGTGCSSATASISFAVIRPAKQLLASLTGAPASASSLLMAGVQRRQTILGGWCSNLETVPLVHVFGNTDTSGRWDFYTPMTVFTGVPTFELLIQYAFADTRQPFGVGLSDMAAYQTPMPGVNKLARAWKSTTSVTSGEETATTASGTTKSYGLVVAFQQQ
jgi:hypothetical protein